MRCCKGELGGDFLGEGTALDSLSTEVLNPWRIETDAAKMLLNIVLMYTLKHTI